MKILDLLELLIDKNYRVSDNELEWEPEPLYASMHITDEDKNYSDRDKDLPIRRVIVIDI